MSYTRSKIRGKILETGIRITPKTCRASIDDNILCLFSTFGLIEPSIIDAITEDELKTFICARAYREPNDHEISRLERIISHVKMDEKLSLLEDRVCLLI